MWLLLHDYFLKCTSAPSATDVCMDDPTYHDSVQHYSLSIGKKHITGHNAIATL